jgi:polyisoprenoid-binding protein YceI
VSGEIVADSAFKPKAFEFDVSVEAKSIFTNSKKRDTHLKSKDFLDARKKPLIEFKSSESKRLTAEEFELTGTLVFNGVSKTLVVKTEVGGPKKVGKLLYRLGVHTTFTVLRSEFEFGPNLDDIGDEVTVTVDLQAEYELPPIG